jgi:hypothetical protein
MNSHHMAFTALVTAYCSATSLPGRSNQGPPEAVGQNTETSSSGCRETKIENYFQGRHANPTCSLPPWTHPRGRYAKRLPRVPKPHGTAYDDPCGAAHLQEASRPTERWLLLYDIMKTKAPRVDTLPFISENLRGVRTCKHEARRKHPSRGSRCRHQMT